VTSCVLLLGKPLVLLLPWSDVLHQQACLLCDVCISFQGALRAAPKPFMPEFVTPDCSSRIVRGLAAPLWIITGLSLAVCGYESLQEAGSLPEAFQSISVANTEPFNLSSFALSLLLVRVLCCRSRCQHFCLGACRINVSSTSHEALLLSCADLQGASSVMRRQVRPEAQQSRWAHRKDLRPRFHRPRLCAAGVPHQQQLRAVGGGAADMGGRRESLAGPAAPGERHHARPQQHGIWRAPAHRACICATRCQAGACWCFCPIVGGEAHVELTCGGVVFHEPSQRGQMSTLSAPGDQCATAGLIQQPVPSLQGAQMRLFDACLQCIYLLAGRLVILILRGRATCWTLSSGDCRNLSIIYTKGVLTCHHDSFHLQADSWFPESEAELLDMVQRWVVAYSRSLQSHLREDGNVEAELQVCSMWRLTLSMRYEPRQRGCQPADVQPRVAGVLASAASWEKQDLPHSAVCQRYGWCYRASCRSTSWQSW